MNPNAESCCMIEGWDLKHCWKRARAQAAREAHFAVADPQSIVSATLQTEHFERRNVQGVYTFLLRHAFTRAHATNVPPLCVIWF